MNQKNNKVLEIKNKTGKIYMKRYGRTIRAILDLLLVLSFIASIQTLTVAEPLVIKKGLMPEDATQGETIRAYAVLHTTNEEVVQASSELNEAVWTVLNMTDGDVIEHTSIDKNGKVISFKTRKGHFVQISVFGTVGNIPNILTVYPDTIVRLEKGKFNDSSVIKTLDPPLSKDTPDAIESKVQLLWARYDIIKKYVPLRQQGEIETVFNEIRSDVAKKDVIIAALKIDGIEKLIDYFENLKEETDKRNMIAIGVFIIGITALAIWRSRTHRIAGKGW